MSFQYWSIAISIALAIISLCIGVYTAYSKNYKIMKLMVQADESENAEDKKRIRKIIFLEKLKTKDPQPLLMVIHYIERLGTEEPFYEGFEALAAELIKRKDLKVRIRIVKALYKLSRRIEKEGNKTSTI